MNSMLLIASLMAMASSGDGAPADTQPTRGIGQYPGAPSEYFAPSVSWVESAQTLTNVALHRRAYASSTSDYNHTAHLVTDGIKDNSRPATLQTSTPDGPLSRREAEWAIDGGPYSRNILMGAHSWLQYDWGGDMSVEAAQIRIQGLVAYDDKVATKGYTLRCQTSDDGLHWQTIGEQKGDKLPGQPLHYQLHSDPNKQESADMLPARRLDETIRFQLPMASDGLHARLMSTQHFRLLFDMDGAAHWDVHELSFLDSEQNVVEVMPSRQFSSMWVSNGGGTQWIYTDLGKSLPIEQLRLDWFLAPKKGVVEVSDDATNWRKVADLNNGATTDLNTSARYVRLLLLEPGEAGCYALREMEVMARQKVVYTPHAVAGMCDGKWMLSGGRWMLQRASEVKASGEQIAAAAYDCHDWIVATVPGTVLASYMNIGAVPDPNYADDVDQISESFFRSNFWYRDEFEVSPALDGQQLWLNFDGINWKANVFLNGKRLGRIEGAFMRGRFNVTGLLNKGTNYLAVEIICNEHFGAIKQKDENTTQFNGGILGADNPTFHATIGWDWITTVRGREAGIWNEVYLSATGMVSVSDPYVETTLSDDGKTAHVRPSVFVHNHASLPVKGTLSGFIGDVRFEKPLTLPAHAEEEVTFDPGQFAQLSNSDFRLWWPNGYGEPYLYDAGFTFKPDAGEPSSVDFKAGLREMRYVGFKDSLRIFVNGQRFVPLGGNWGFDEHNLLYRSREYDIAVRYHRDMNFTMIRDWVGQVADEAFYEACDKYGVMIWQDFWLANPADGPDPYDNVLFLSNAKDYLRRIRGHASIALYCGRNEGFPPEAIDRKLREYVHTLAPGMEFISHSSGEGVSGGGPYRALPIKEYFSRQTGKIHSERGMPNVMNIESLSRALSKEALWPQSVEWGQHDYTLMGAQRAAEFNRLVSMGFGEASSAEEFTRWAQLVNYNGYRAMFESTSKSRAGMLLWMSHPCWPSMVWQTYDYYFEPTAAYFGSKKACEPLHIQFNALTDSIEVVCRSIPVPDVPLANISPSPAARLTAIATIFDINGKRVCQRKGNVRGSADTTTAWLRLSDMLPAPPSDVYYLRLQLTDKTGVVSENLYVMAREENNFKALSSVPKAEVEQKVSLKTTGNSQVAQVVLHNKSRVPATFLRLNLVGADGEQILPALYSDNYVTLMPGERTTIIISWKTEDARGQQSKVVITAL